MVLVYHSIIISSNWVIQINIERDKVNAKLSKVLYFKTEVTKLMTYEKWSASRMYSQKSNPTF